MLARYGTSEEGKIVKKADIYTVEEHGIRAADLDSDALAIVGRLKAAGYRAYIVGGALRDLLTGKKPKDYDVATEAYPRTLRRLFRNSRVIGRRFRLVHVIFQRGGRRKIIEVSTFRAGRASDHNNVYGSIEEDVWRRDFTLNALYYSPDDGFLIDFVGGYRDVRRGRLRTLVPAEESFQEDPVRIIRGIKYSATTGFALSGSMSSLIRRRRETLRECSPARLTEELYKILETGFAAPILETSYQLGVLEAILPALAEHLRFLGRSGWREALSRDLGRLDRLVAQGEQPPPRGVLLGLLFRDLLERRLRESTAADWRQADSGEGPGDPERGKREWLQAALREAAQPLSPSKREIEEAVRQHLGPGPRRARRRGPRSRRGPRRSPRRR